MKLSSTESMAPENHYRHITRHCFVNAPFALLKEDLLNYITTHGIQPEIGLDGDVVYQYSKVQYEEVAAVIAAAGLGCTLHAPFQELCLGDADLKVRRRSFEKLKRAFELIPIFRPKSVVCHLNFHEQRDRFREGNWFAFSLLLWRELLAMATETETPVMFENTYELGPAMHRRFLETINSRLAGFCLDAGHVMAFAKNSWRDWLPALDPWLGQLHLHDNRGMADEHCALGMGRFDFPAFFSYLQEKKLRPLVTLEPHHREWLWQSLEYLDRLGPLNPASPVEVRGCAKP